MRILGVDPGLRLTGYACLEVRPGSGAGARADRSGPGAAIVEAGVLRLNTRLSVPDRLVELDRDFRDILQRLRPDAVAVEQLFAACRHPATAIVMGHARGVLLLAVRSAPLPLIELRATEVKKSLTAYGHAAKAQVQDAVQSIFRLAQRPRPPDVADAIAIALCALRRA
jgi:crossover junction endodeoxyribonuclease RuvC